MEETIDLFQSQFVSQRLTNYKSLLNNNQCGKTGRGEVLIGMDDMGKPVHGFTLGQETLQKWVNEVKQKTQPSIIPEAGIVQIKGVKVGKLSVREFPVKPVACRGRYFRRIKNSNHQLNPTEISDLHLQSLQLSWDSYPYPGAKFGYLNEEKINRFIKKVNDGGRGIK